MEKLVITGPTPLKGEVNISGAKNSAVAILPATLLIDGVCVINNVPNIVDIKLSCEILEGLGAKIKWIDKNSLEIDTRNITKTEKIINKRWNFLKKIIILIIQKTK
jgi:UDP-N-acetylglucosamine 1-carboxyvinyltransferase